MAFLICYVALMWIFRSRRAWNESLACDMDGFAYTYLYKLHG